MFLFILIGFQISYKINDTLLYKYHKIRFPKFLLKFLFIIMLVVPWFISYIFINSKFIVINSIFKIWLTTALIGLLGIPLSDLLINKLILKE